VQIVALTDQQIICIAYGVTRRRDAEAGTMASERDIANALSIYEAALRIASCLSVGPSVPHFFRTRERLQKAKNMRWFPYRMYMVDRF